MSRSCISVVLPVYNEEDNIGPCLRGLATALAGTEHEILVCYDFDEDTTLGAIARMDDKPASVRLVKNELGRGAANALRAGFAAAQGDVVVTTMADLSDPPDKIPDMAREIRAGCVVVSGSRYMRGGSQTGGPLVKRTLSRAACLSLSWIANVGTHDATTNFKAYARSFLERVEVESRTAFDIALELTVKAHLAGERVGEVPSTWRDRSAGTSRFKVWAWMPRYLRWYGRAIREPVAVGALWVALFALAFLGKSPEEARLALLFALGAGFWILFARSARGRTKWIDALFPALWLHPWHGEIRGEIGLSADLALTFVASAVVAWIGCGWTAIRGSFVRVAARARGLASGKGLLACALALLLWASRFTLPQVSGSADLDPSWVQSYDHFLARGMQAGVDYVFTYGPLASFEYGEFHPELYWPRVVVWEGAFELALAATFVAAGWRIAGSIGRAAYFLALPFALSNGADTYPMLGCVAATSLLVTRARPTALATAGGLAILAVLGMLKFTLLVFALGCAASVALSFACRRELAACVGTLVLGALVFLSVWVFAGQAVAHAPSYFASALSLSGGYDSAMSLPAPSHRLQLAVAVFASMGVLLALRAFGRTSASRTLPMCAVLAAGSFLAFKSGFVRQLGELTFFGFALVAPFLELSTGVGARASGLALHVSCAIARAACAALALAGIVSVQTEPSWRSLPAIAERWSVGLVDHVASMTRIVEHEKRCESERAMTRERLDLPRIREAVGTEAVDVFPPFQALVFANDLRWSPRPVFQGYAAFTPELLALNGAFFESERAPPYVLFRMEAFERRLPMMEDSLARAVVLRDYRPILEEKKLLLMRREARGVPLPDAPPELEFEREIELGEWLDLPPATGNERLLALDIDYSTRGRIEKFLYQAPAVSLFLTTGAAKYQCRIVPEIMRDGVLLEPLFLRDEDFARWTREGRSEPVESLRVGVAAEKRDCYEPRIRVRLLRPARAMLGPFAEAR